MNKPKIYFCVGLPGSGKSTWAENNKEELNAIIHSSDNIRSELGDVNDQSQNELVFTTLHKRIKEDLLHGKNVIYDSTGISRKNRMHFLRQIENIYCEKICVLFATPIISCRKNNRNRDRQVPEDVITKMVKSFNVPCKQEGWDSIQIVYWDYIEDGLLFNFDKDVGKWKSISHNNPHHALTIGDHMIAAYDYMWENTDNIYLIIAAYLHDCGKVICKRFVDHKGNQSEIAHFYNHENVSSYNSLFYLKEFFEEIYNKFTDQEILYIALLIELHMRPYVWTKSAKAKAKDERIFGDHIIKDLKMLNRADRAAH